MKILLLAAMGGALGAAARHLIGIAVMRVAGPAMILPWGTLIVNIVGSFLMGVLVEAFALRYTGTLETRAFLATGILGGFTTFSTFSLDAVSLINHKQHLLATVYIASSVTLSILAFYVGLMVMRQVLS